MRKEIRFSGNGGQGVILASVILGTAAALYEKIGDKQGKLIALNIVSLSAFVEVTKLVSEDSLEKAVLQAAPKGTEDFNMEAVKIGRELAKTLK
ncbi:hypothetical protein J6Z19_01455 [bacterium]|nr:hypothetical protein [bacterium]